MHKERLREAEKLNRPQRIKRYFKWLFQKSGDARIEIGDTEIFYPHREGKRDWAGPKFLDEKDMTWKRPEHYYFRSAVDGKVRQHTQIKTLDRVRPGPLRGVGPHLDVPMAVLRSHPDTPETLPPQREGAWMSTNPAWPEMTVNSSLGQGVRAVWEDSSPDNFETFELGPHTLKGIVVYVKPNESPK